MKKTLTNLFGTLLFCSIAVFGMAQEEQPIVEVTTYDIHCLTPPEGFTTKENFPGYLHLSTKSSLIVSVVKNRNLIDAEESLNDDYFKREKVTLVSKEPFVTNNGEKGLLYKFAFEINGESWLRYSLFLGDLNNVLWINANYLVKYQDVVEEELLKSMLTTKFKIK